MLLLPRFKINFHTYKLPELIKAGKTTQIQFDERNIILYILIIVYYIDVIGEIMEKLDLMKTNKGFFKASASETLFLELPPLPYLMIDGHGDPNTSQLYKDSIQALYSLAYTVKFAIRNDQQKYDVRVMPLEGLWWTVDMNQFSAEKKDDWDWTMMILQPELVTLKIFAESCKQVLKKKGLILVEKIKLETYKEGLCAQILHLGPYSAEKSTIDKLHAAIAEKGYQRSGKHHEIYLNSPLRTAPQKLKTIIRQPVGK